MGKERLNTRKHRHAADRRKREENKVLFVESTFRYRHDAHMRQALRGVDIERYEALAGPG